MAVVWQGGEERTEEPAEGEEVRVWGNLVANVERLDDEMFKSLQVIDPHTHKYLERMQDEPLFLALAQRVRFPLPGLQITYIPAVFVI